MSEPENKPIFMIDMIKQFMLDRKCTMDDLTGASKKQIHVKLRRDLIRQLHSAGFSASAIARRMQRDHTTICHHLGHIKGSAPKRLYGEEKIVFRA